MTDESVDPTDPEVWHANKHRPAWIRRHHDDLLEAVNVEKAPPSNLAELDDWLDRYKSTMTRQLTDDTDEQKPTSGGDE